MKRNANEKKQCSTMSRDLLSNLFPLLFIILPFYYLLDNELFLENRRKKLNFAVTLSLSQCEEVIFLMENPEIDLLLLLAVSLSPNSIKDIASASGIKANTIYKWKTTSANLSPKKMNALLHYFAEEEPLILTIAEIVEVVLILLFTSTSSFSEEEVTEEE